MSAKGSLGREETTGEEKHELFRFTKPSPFCRSSCHSRVHCSRVNINSFKLGSTDSQHDSKPSQCDSEPILQCYGVVAILKEHCNLLKIELNQYNMNFLIRSRFS